jgi:hypothetical protein
MLRAWAHMRKTELLEDAANRYLVEIDIEAFLDDASKVDASPPHHAIDGGIGAGFQDPLQLLFLLRRQFRAWAGSLAVDQPLGTLLVVPVRSVPQRLPIHCANLGGDLTAHPVEHLRQRQQPPRLICILCPFRQHPQFASTQIRAQSHRRAHRRLANQFHSQSHATTRAGSGESGTRVIFNEDWYNARDQQTAGDRTANPSQEFRAPAAACPCFGTQTRSAFGAGSDDALTGESGPEDTDPISAMQLAGEQRPNLGRLL